MARAFLFPGQGSHEVGMGADLLRSDEWVRDQVRRVSEKTGEDLERICLRGPERQLMQAARVQPLMTIISLGYAHRLAERGITPDVVAGHSLGEIPALAVAGVVSPEHAVAVAFMRGILMDEAAAANPGGMAAVFLPLAEVEALIDRLGMAGRIHIANDNAPTQVVVSGETDALADFAHRTNGERPGCCKPLRISGPWHTPLLNEACSRFEAWLKDIPFGAPRIPLIANATATAETNPARLRHLAARQLIGRVHWRETMEELRSRQVTHLIEIGPGRVLAGLARLNGFGNETTARGVDSLRAVDQVAADCSGIGGQ